MQLDIPTSWDKHKVFEVIDEMRLNETSDMNVRIKAVLTDDLDMFAEIANTVLRNIHDLRTEVNLLMSSILTGAKINTTQHAEVGFNLKIPDRRGTYFFAIWSAVGSIKVFLHLLSQSVRTSYRVSVKIVMVLSYSMDTFIFDN